MSYDIHTDVKYGPREVFDAGRLADECREKWWNQTLCRVNDCVVRLGVFEGEFHFHQHDLWRASQRTAPVPATARSPAASQPLRLVTSAS